MTNRRHDPTRPPHLDPNDPANYLPPSERQAWLDFLRDSDPAPPCAKPRRKAKRKRAPLPLPTLDDEGRVLYFAFGSNMDEEQMERRCPDAFALYPATMAGYRIIFTGHSRRWGGGVATIVRDKSTQVEGLVYSLTADDVRKLDACEGAPFVYQRIEFDLHEDDRVRRCITYIHRSTKEVAPGLDYYRQIRRAYEDNAFDVAPLHRAVERFPPPRRRKPASVHQLKPDPRPIERKAPRKRPAKTRTSDASKTATPDLNADLVTAKHKHLVFVYGTLLHGLGNHKRHLDHDGAEFVGEDATRDEFHMVDLGWFPGIMRGGRTTIAGEVYRVDDETLAGLDALEGVPTLYTRQRARLASGLVVNVYVLNTKRAKGCRRVMSGDWRAHKAGAGVS